jgi:hypothetical protein
MAACFVIINTYMWHPGSAELPPAHDRLLETWCGYTESPGGPELRQAIAALYDQPDHIRIGFGRANMPDALDVLEANLTPVFR